MTPPGSPGVGDEITGVRAGSNKATGPLESCPHEIKAAVAVRGSVIVTRTGIVDPGAMTQKILKGTPKASRGPRWVGTGAGVPGSKPTAQSGV